MKQLTWLRIVQSGDGCLRLVLHTPNGTSSSSSSLFGMDHQCVAPLAANSLHSGLFRASSIACQKWMNEIFIYILICKQLIITCFMWARERCRISPSRFLAECHKTRLNQGCFDLLYFCIVCLFWVVFLVCVFSCTVLFVIISQVIGCEDLLQSDLL